MSSVCCVRRVSSGVERFSLDFFFFFYLYCRMILRYMFRCSIRMLLTNGEKDCWKEKEKETISSYSVSHLRKERGYRRTTRRFFLVVGMRER